MPITSWVQCYADEDFLMCSVIRIILLCELHVEMLFDEFDEMIQIEGFDEVVHHALLIHLFSYRFVFHECHHDDGDI